MLIIAVTMPVPPQKKPIRLKISLNSIVYIDSGKFSPRKGISTKNALLNQRPVKPLKNMIEAEIFCNSLTPNTPTDVRRT